MTEVQGPKQRQNDDEIDLVELILELWKGKMLILAFVIACFCLGFAYTKMVSVTYSVTSHYIVDLYPDEAFKLCDKGALRDKDCLEEKTLAMFSSFLPQWSVDSKAKEVGLSVKHSHRAVADYSLDLGVANNHLTQSILEEAKESLAIINGLDVDLRSTETVAKELLSAKRMIYLIEVKKKQVLTLATPVVQKKSPKVALILVISVLLGGMLGVFAVLMKKFVAELKSRS